MALHAYRDLLRSARLAFRGDLRLLSGAISQARAGYESNRQLPPSSDEAAAAVKHASDVAKMLRENVVQGEKMEGQGQEQDRYQLRIHHYTERGDNDTVKQGGKNMGAALMGECCGGGAFAR